MVRFVLPLVCVTLSACGLERDWAAWQELGRTNGDSAATETGTSSTGLSSMSGSSSSSGETTDNSETGLAETSMGVSTGTTVGETGGTVETTGAAAACGDGVVAGEEECDDPGDTACFNCVRDRLV